MKRILLPLLLLSGLRAAAQTPQLVTDINPGTAGSYVATITPFNSALYMAADDGTNGTELYRYTGTGAATLVYNLNPGSASGAVKQYGRKMGVLNGKLYFAGNNGSTGVELFSYDGSNAPTAIEINAGATGSGPIGMTVIGTKMYFAATTTAAGTELYIYEGTGNPQLYDVNPGAGGSGPSGFTELNGKVYFSATTTTGGAELYSYNPSSNSTALVADINTGALNSYPLSLVKLGTKLYFSASTATYGRELYSYDGSSVQRLTDITTGTGSGVAEASIAAYNGYLYFGGSTTGDKYKLYRYDPSTNTTSLVYDINPNAGTQLGEMAEYDGKLYFVASDQAHGLELWMTDGSTTSIAADLNPGTAGSDPTDLQVFNGALYFDADNGSVGYELFRIGNAAGIVSTGFGGSLTVHPNPTTGDALLELTLEQAGRYSVQISDATGRTVWQSAVSDYPQGAHRISLPLQSQAPGSYFYQLRHEGRPVAAGRLQKL